MADILAAEAVTLAARIDALKRTYPELEDDGQLLADMVEGSTDFNAVLDKVAVAFLSAVSLKQANADLVDTLTTRGSRFERRAEAFKALAFDLMRAAGTRKVELPSATLSIAKGRPKLVLDDDFNAQGYMRVKAEPMRTDIAAALAVGNDIPGARLEQAPDHLAIRTK